ncbi:MAG: BlaI/MecI/CopY family transcriptional regulator [Acidobacteria bacterium]|nr:BlaI/MecI/CopY family transcriptional regulator [Acidobacteriota bacterium]
MTVPSPPPFNRGGNHGRLLPPLELEAMKALWQLGEATVRQVNTEMNRRRPLAYTTVLTLLDRLARKGAAGRRKQGRAHFYVPLISREAALEMVIDRLARDFFDGSRERLLNHLRGRSPEPAEAAAAEAALDAALL